MITRKLVLTVAILLFFAGTAWAQFIPDPDVQGKIQDARQPITLRGKIAYQEVGGYIVKAERAGDKIILNQNYEVLKKLAEKHQEVTIDGRTNPLDISARYIYIESINGKPYHGDRAPMVKPPTKLTPLF